MCCGTQALRLFRRILIEKSFSVLNDKSPLAALPYKPFKTLFRLRFDGYKIYFKF